MPPTQQKDIAALIKDRKFKSWQWMSANYYPEWQDVYKAYKGQRDPAKDIYGNPDKTQTSFGMPDTWSLANRQIARLTAQIPNLHYHARDIDKGNRISRTLMRQWDMGGVQKTQKRHVQQLTLFGWSVRGWWWDVDEVKRKRRVDPFSQNTDPSLLQQVRKQYADEIGELMAEMEQPDEMAAMAQIVAEKGRRGLLPIEYDYIAYEGPRAEFLFVGDCFPEPNFVNLQASKWFITERRRDLDWMKKTGERYPDFKQGFDDLIEKYPKGTPRTTNERQTQSLRRSFLSVDQRQENTGFAGTDDEKQEQCEWTFTECHMPGGSAKLQLSGEDDIFIGEIEYPYDLEGRIAFSEACVKPDLLYGVGDSDCRIIQPLQRLHDRQVMSRFDLIDRILRPLIATTDRELYENPALMERHKGYRLLFARGGIGSVQVLGEQGAIAAAAAGMQDEQSIMRAIQQASGDSNLSQAANVDPQQARTATGAKLMAFNQDLLSKAMIDEFAIQAISEDAKIMYLMNRSELGDRAVEFDAQRYNRTYSSAGPPIPAIDWMSVTAEDFQEDGEVEAEAGSTLADDDERNISVAQNLFNVASSRPDLFNQIKARDTLLIAMGKGKELPAWNPPQQGPPPEPKPKASVTVSVKAEMLPDEVLQQILKDADLVPPDFPMSAGAAAGAAPGGSGAMPPPGAPPMPPPPMPRPVPHPQQPHKVHGGHSGGNKLALSMMTPEPLGASSYRAATKNSAGKPGPNQIP